MVQQITELLQLGSRSKGGGKAHLRNDKTQKSHPKVAWWGGVAYFVGVGLGTLMMMASALASTPAWVIAKFSRSLASTIVLIFSPTG